MWFGLYFLISNKTVMEKLSIVAVLILIYLLKNTRGMEISIYSNSTLIPEGQSHIIFCQTSDPYLSCWWMKESRALCGGGGVWAVDINSKNGSACGKNNHITWILSSNMCGIRIDGFTATDKGKYECFAMTKNKKGKSYKVSNQAIYLQILTLAEVSIQQMIDSTSFGQVTTKNNQIDAQCSITGGHPKPKVHASIGYMNRQTNDVHELETLIQQYNMEIFTIFIST